ncbi:MAG TPA: FlgD immunoglobulin-like domain containing protein, partial [Gemmataceae bacterium]|nr:FlgD immunoglobulin-like domain containing protein [Gemmataceae bacterium]
YPDGWGSPGSTDIASYGGIAGIIHPRQMFLAGLFLDDSEPQDPAPGRLDFRPTGLDTTFSDLNPGLRQIFFIGDGLKPALNTQQSFHVPNGATRMYLGFADAGSFFGTPGYYDDDFGSMAANVSICGQDIAAVPPPGPAGFELLGARPNPLSEATEISFSLSKPQSVALKIFDVSGQLVRRLTDGLLSAGPHSAQWDRRDDGGRQVPAGVYFYSLDAGEQRKSSRVVVLK